MPNNLVGKLKQNNQINGQLNQPLTPWTNDHSKLQNLEYAQSGHTGFTSATDFSAFASSLAVVATTGKYTDLLQLPVIPSKTSQITNDTDLQNSTQVGSLIQAHNVANNAHQFIQNNLATESTTRQNADTNLQNQIVANDTDIANLQNLKANKTEIPTKVSQLQNDSGFINSIPAEYVTNTEMVGYAQPIGDYSTNTALTNETTARISGDNTLQAQINTLQSKTDVVDIVGTYQALLNYDTTKLSINNIIKVLDDSTHDNNRAYYRYTSVTAPKWTFIGQEVDVGTVVTVGGVGQDTWNSDLKANVANPTFTGNVSGITKTMVGLGNVDNTSDLNKPISNATQTALNLKANVDSLAKVATTGQYADLLNTPTIPTLTSQLTNDSNYQNNTQVSAAIENRLIPATEQEAISGTDNTKVMTALRTKQQVDSRIGAGIKIVNLTQAEYDVTVIEPIYYFVY
ncbi:MAG: hypothetical protein RR313_09795 [Anaerovoracaceae bacterium]